MKKILFCLSIMALLGCGGEVPPKHNVRVFGSYIKETRNDLHLFSKFQQCEVSQEEIPYQDTLSVDGKLYYKVFFVEIIPKKLHKDFKNLGMVPCSLRDIYSKRDTVRKQVPGFGERKFLVVEDVVGVQ